MTVDEIMLETKTGEEYRNHIRKIGERNRLERETKKRLEYERSNSWAVYQLQHLFRSW